MRIMRLTQLPLKIKKETFYFCLNPIEIPCNNRKKPDFKFQKETKVNKNNGNF